MNNPPTLSVSEAAAATGFTSQAVYRAIRDGRLSRYLLRDGAGRARLMPEAVEAIRRGLLRQRVDTAPPPPPAPEPEPEPEPIAAEIWGDWANALLDLTQWAPPPWSGTRWASLAITADQAYGLAEQYGPCTTETLAMFEADAEADE